jgi:hypothetical protein
MSAVTAKYSMSGSRSRQRPGPLFCFEAPADVLRQRYLTVVFRPDEADSTDRERILTARRALQMVAEGTGDAASRWDRVFREFLLSDDQLALVVRSLHEDQQYESAVLCLESAIRAGRAAPWLYDVLALQMRLSGRPSGQIARVLKSRLDFGISDIPQLLLTAAMLSRFEAWEPAIDTLRDIEQLSPTASAELWLLARSIADKSGDTEAIVWSRCGILRYIWDPGYEREHAEAKRTVQELVARLQNSGDEDAAGLILSRLQSASQIDLQITLRWAGAADLDLIIRDPSGQECSFRRRTTPTLGRLVRETGIAKPASGTREEVFIQPEALSGEYEIAVRFALGEVPSGTAILSITQAAGTAGERTETRSIRLGQEDTLLKTLVNKGRSQLPAAAIDDVQR